MFFKDLSSSKMLHLSPKPACRANLMVAAFAHPCGTGARSSWHPIVLPFCQVLGAVFSVPHHWLWSWEWDVHVFKAEVCEGCLILSKALGEASCEALGLFRQMTDYYVMAYRMWPLPPEEAQTHSLSRIERADLKFSNVMRLIYQNSPSPWKEREHPGCVSLR